LPAHSLKAEAQFFRAENQLLGQDSKHGGGSKGKDKKALRPTRLFRQLSNLSFKEAQRLCNVDFDPNAAFAAVTGPRERLFVISGSMARSCSSRAGKKIACNPAGLN
jgi:hypothetical protein